MKLTKAQIKQIIKEEIEQVMKELEDDAPENQRGETEEEELMRKLNEPMHK